MRWRTSWQIRLKQRISVGRYGLNGVALMDDWTGYSTANS